VATDDRKRVTRAEEVRDDLKELAFMRCWFDIMRARGVAAADCEMWDNQQWRAPGAPAPHIP
jgi:hypothetical protein